MPDLKTPRVLNAKIVLAESDIHSRGPNEEPGLDLTWKPNSDDVSLPDTRLRGMRAAGSASIYFRFEGDEWIFEVCGFVGGTSPKSGSCPTIQEAIEIAVAELSNRINLAWKNEFAERAEVQKTKDLTQEALKIVLEMKRDASNEVGL